MVVDMRKCFSTWNVPFTDIPRTESFHRDGREFHSICTVTKKLWNLLFLDYRKNKQEYSYPSEFTYLEFYNDIWEAAAAAAAITNHRIKMFVGGKFKKKSRLEKIFKTYCITEDACRKMCITHKGIAKAYTGRNINKNASPFSYNR